MVTQQVPPSAKHAAPGVEIAFFAKGGDAGARWDRFVDYVSENHPESLRRPVMLAEDATDQVRRAHPRLVPQPAVQIGGEIGGARAQSITVANISDGGMFIRTEDVFLVGSDLRVTLEHPRTRERIPVDCVVRRRTLGSGAGIGVEFRDIDDAHRGALRELMDAAGAARPVQAHCEEVLATKAPRMMNTLPGPGSFGAARIVPAEDSWAGLEELGA
jgi:Tfp pilus assembly protein PilZ